MTELEKTVPIRTIIILGGSPAVTIPKSYGFKKGEHVIVEKINDNTCKISKIEWNKITQNEDQL